MPSFATSSVVHDNADAYSIQLHARHVFVARNPSDVVYAVKDGIPSDLDVILQSDLVISLSGTFDRTRREGRDLQNSAIAQHLLDYFHANSDNLGVRPSSKLFLDEEDGNTKLTLSPTRPILETRSPHIALSSIDLLYVFTTLLSPSQTPGILVVDPFSPNAFLPLVAALDRLVEKLVARLVKQYPLIFGLWRERFDVEATVFSKLSRALADIICRSPHTAFRKSCRRVTKMLHKSDLAATGSSASSLQAILGNSTIECLLIADDGTIDLKGVSDPFDYCDTFSRAMERVYKTTSKSLRYKGLRPTNPGRDRGKPPDDEFMLSESLEPPARSAEMDQFYNIELDARVSAELWFDEDAETMGGSQEGEGLFYDDNPESINDIDIWVSDEPESPAGPPLEDSDDLWDSSQSTTLDDPMLEWAGLSSSDSSQTSYTTGPDAPFSDPYPRAELPDFPQDLITDDDEDASWPNDQPDRALDDQPLAPFSPLSTAFQPSETMSLDMDLAYNLHPSMHPSGSGCSIPGYPPSHTRASSPPFEETLDMGWSTSYFPILMDDDLEGDEGSDSRSRPPTHTQATLPPPSPGTRPGAQII